MRHMSALGLTLMAVGAALMVAEAHLASHGVLGSAAAAVLTAGVVLALSGAGASAGVVLAAAIAVGAAGLGLAWVVLVKSLGVRRMADRTGARALLGRVATVRRVPAPEGQVQLDGALWRARLWELEADSGLVAEGSAVVVEAIDGLTLTVRPAEEWELHGR